MGIENKNNKDRIPNPGKIQKPEFGMVRLDIAAKEVCLLNGEKGRHLSDSEYQVMWYLIRAQGEVVSRDQLAEFLYEELPDHQDLPLGNGIEVFISRARTKLESLTGGKMTVITLRGLGYRIGYADESTA